MTYNPGQFRNIVPYIDGVPDWLILGGPADGDEAQCAIKQWPSIKVVGVEPVEHLRDWQLANGWRASDPLLPMALSDRVGVATFFHPLWNESARRCGSLMEERYPQHSHGSKEYSVYEIATTTIDDLSAKFGPFTRAVLWLDIEGYELEALRGALSLLFQDVLAVNVEILERRIDRTRDLERLFYGLGFRLAHTWNQQPGLVEDRVYVPI